MVHCTGVLNHNPNYEEMLKEMYRVSKKYCIFDLPRLVAGDYEFDVEKSFMILQERFEGKPDQIMVAETKVPYVLVNAKAIFDYMLKGLYPTPQKVFAVGYYGHTKPSVTIPFETVCFCVVFIEKGVGGNQITFGVDLPEDIASLLQYRGINKVANIKGQFHKLV